MINLQCLIFSTKFKLACAKSPFFCGTLSEGLFENLVQVPLTWQMYLKCYLLYLLMHRLIRKASKSSLFNDNPKDPHMEMSTIISHSCITGLSYRRWNFNHLANGKTCNRRMIAPYDADKCLKIYFRRI